MNRIFPNMPIHELAGRHFQKPTGVAASLDRLRELAEELPLEVQESLSLLLCELNASVINERVCFQKLFDASPDGYVVTDAQFKIDHANPSMERLCRVEVSNLCGISILDLFCEQSRSLIVQRLRLLTLENADEDPCIDMQACLVSADKSKAPVSLRVLVLRVHTTLSLRWIIRPA